MIATAGRPDLLRRTLASLAACERPATYRRTLVIENGAQRGAETVVGDFRESLNATYEFVARPNKSAALNSAIDAAGDALVYFSDDDVRYAPGVLAAYDRAARGVLHGTFFGGPTGVDYESEPPAWLKAFLPRSAAGFEWKGAPKVTTASFLGFNWAAFATDIRAAGGFDPNRGPGSPTGSTGQETDMQRRLLAAGLSGMYVPDAKVWHYIAADRATPAWALERNYRQGVEHGRQRFEDGPTVAGLPLWVQRRRVQVAVRGAIAAVAGSEVAKFRAEHRRHHLRGVIDGIRQRRGEDSAKRQAADAKRPVGMVAS